MNLPEIRRFYCCVYFWTIFFASDVKRAVPRVKLKTTMTIIFNDIILFSAMGGMDSMPFCKRVSMLRQ